MTDQITQTREQLAQLSAKLQRIDDQLQQLERDEREARQKTDDAILQDDSTTYAMAKERQQNLKDQRIHLTQSRGVTVGEMSRTRRQLDELVQKRADERRRQLKERLRQNRATAMQSLFDAAIPVLIDLSLNEGIPVEHLQLNKLLRNYFDEHYHQQVENLKRGLLDAMNDDDYEGDQPWLN